MIPIEFKIKGRTSKERAYQVQISKILNITERGYRFIEKGEKKPSCDVVINLQNLFNQPIDHLLEQEVDTK